MMKKWIKKQGKKQRLLITTRNMFIIARKVQCTKIRQLRNTKTNRFTVRPLLNINSILS